VFLLADVDAYSREPKRDELGERERALVRGDECAFVGFAADRDGSAGLLLGHWIFLIVQRALL
jgi:hypothetical protein